MLSDGGLDYNTVFNQMTPDQVSEANLALDKMIEMQKQASKPRKRR